MRNLLGGMHGHSLWPVGLMGLQAETAPERGTSHTLFTLFSLLASKSHFQLLPALRH